METMKRKGVSTGRTPRPALDRTKAKRNISYESSDSIGRNRDRELTPSNSNVSRRDDDEEWVEFSVHGKPDLRQMSMMLREIGLSPLQLGITADDWNRGKRETESLLDNGPRDLSTSLDMYPGEDTHEGDSRTSQNQSHVGEEYQPNRLSTPAKTASAPSRAAEAVGHNVVRENNGHTENAKAPSPEARPPVVSNHPRDGGVDVNYTRSGSLPAGVGLQEDLRSRPTNHVEAVQSPRTIERTRSEPVPKCHVQAAAAIAPPPSLNNNPIISALQTDRRRKQEEAGQSRGPSSIGSLTLKPPPRKNVLKIAPMLSTAAMIHSLGPDAVDGRSFFFSDSEGEDEEKAKEKEGEDSTDPSPPSAPSTVQKEPVNHLSNGAEITSRTVNQPEEPNTERVNETEGELTVRQVGERLTVESANGSPEVMDLTAVLNSPDMEHPVVSRTSSMYMEGPKFPWTKGTRLGAGSFGTVYNAVDSGGMFFAVKEVSVIEQDKQALQALAQLKQEVELLKKFKHENIVQYLGTDQVADKLYIFLELVELGSLAAVYKNFELVDSQISKYARDILKGLEYLHDRNILHRDIKCANILVDKTGTCKLADFGMAKQISSLDLTKSCMGSAYWMAPEVINPQKSYGPPADIWSLGCSVLEMATRAPPFGEMEWYRAMFTVGRGNAPPIPETLSDSLRDFVKHCFEIEPKKRPTAAELLYHPFITRGTPTSGPPLVPRSAANLQPITEERSSDFSSQQSTQESASLDAEGREN